MGTLRFAHPTLACLEAMKMDLSKCHWGVELLGDEIDLRTACALFEHGRDLRIQTVPLRTGLLTTLLLASGFEKLLTAEEVNDECLPVVDFLNGILFIVDQERTPLRANAICERQTDGSWSAGIAFSSVHFEGGARMRVILSTIPGTIPPEEKWMMGAVSDSTANDVLTYLRGEPDWFELYKAHETIGAKSDRFTETAQAARHSNAYCKRKGIRKYMSLKEAREHVRALVQEWLNRRFT